MPKEAQVEVAARCCVLPLTKRGWQLGFLMPKEVQVEVAALRCMLLLLRKRGWQWSLTASRIIPNISYHIIQISDRGRLPALNWGSASRKGMGGAGGFEEGDGHM